jgi:CheY-like chemotaxis protein
MRVLLIEDSADDNRVTLLGLKRLQIPVEITTARDGVEALRLLFGENSELPDLVVLDLYLPRLAGLAVLRRIRGEKSTRSLPIVILTGSQDDTGETQCYSLGATECLLKSTDLNGFTKCLEQVIEKFGLARAKPIPRRNSTALADGHLPR